MQCTQPRSTWRMSDYAQFIYSHVCFHELCNTIYTITVQWQNDAARVRLQKFFIQFYKHVCDLYAPSMRCP